MTERECITPGQVSVVAFGDNSAKQIKKVAKCIKELLVSGDNRRVRLFMGLKRGPTRMSKNVNEVGN